MYSTLQHGLRLYCYSYVEIKPDNLNFNENFLNTLCNTCDYSQQSFKAESKLIVLLEHPSPRV